MKQEHVKAAVGRLLANGYKGGAISTLKLLEEVSFLARLSGLDGTAFVHDCISHRDQILAKAGVFDRGVHHGYDAAPRRNCER